MDAMEVARERDVHMEDMEGVHNTDDKENPRTDVAGLIGGVGDIEKPCMDMSARMDTIRHETQ